MTAAGGAGADALLERIVDAFGVAAPPERDRVGEAILDAALAVIAANGASASVDAIARRAGCNRVTVYRHFGDRDGLLAALSAREAHRMADELRRVAARATDPADLVAEGFVAAVRLATAHPLVARAIRHEPQALLGALAADDARVLRVGGAAVAAVIRHAQASGRAPHVDADAAGLVAARLLASLLLLPGPEVDLDDPVALRRYADDVLTPLLLGP